MKSHEAYEERKLYPYLEAKYDTNLATLTEQHDELGVLDTQVRAAWDGTDALAVAHALGAHDKALVRHLADEENAVIPLLLSLPRSEFEHFAISTPQALARERMDSRH